MYERKPGNVNTMTGDVLGLFKEFRSFYLQSIALSIKLIFGFLK